MIRCTNDSEIISFEDGCYVVRIKSVKEYASFIVANFAQPDYVFRGQKDAVWEPESSFQRLSQGAKITQEDLRKHLINFRFAARSCKETNLRGLSENEWWALGQHFGLCTPLLDWTRSNWVALYFAFRNIQTKCQNRAVYVINLTEICNESNIKTRTKVEIIDSTEAFYNPRLTNQAALLLKLPIQQTFSKWVKSNFKGWKKVILCKIIIPNKYVEYCHRDLNRMNINEVSLFANLESAGHYANILYKIPDMAHPIK